MCSLKSVIIMSRNGGFSGTIYEVSTDREILSECEQTFSHHILSIILSFSNSLIALTITIYTPTQHARRPASVLKSYIRSGITFL